MLCTLLRALVLPIFFLGCAAQQRSSPPRSAPPEVYGDSHQPAAFLSSNGCTSRGESLTACEIQGSLALARGPPVALPARLEVSGPHGSAAAATEAPKDSCGLSTGTTWSVLNPPSSSGQAPALDLSMLSGVFVIPPNGSVAVRDLVVSGVLLPVSPYPLPAASFLALSAFRLPSAASATTSKSRNTSSTTAPSPPPPPPPPPPLQLYNLMLSTPSCTALSLHQEFACRASPSPNFTVTPSSLIVHTFTTPTASITNVTLICTGQPAPFPCLAATASSYQQVLQPALTAQYLVASGAWPFTGDVLLAVYVYLCRNISVLDGGSGGSDLTPPVTLSNVRLVVSGAADGATVFDLADTPGALTLESGATQVELLNLTVRNPPLGPADQAPASLLRIGLWSFAFPRMTFGASRTTLLARGLRIELPPDELALWFADLLGGRTAVPEQLRGSLCATGGDMSFSVEGAKAVEASGGAGPSLSFATLRMWSGVGVLEDVTLVGTQWDGTNGTRGCCGCGASTASIDGSKGSSGGCSTAANSGALCAAPPPAPQQSVPGATAAAAAAAGASGGAVLCAPSAMQRCPLCRMRPASQSTAAAAGAVLDLKDLLQLSEPSPFIFSTSLEVSAYRVFLLTLPSVTLKELKITTWPAKAAYPGKIACPAVLFGSFSDPMVFDLGRLPGAFVLQPSSNASLTVRAAVLAGLPPAGIFPVLAALMTEPPLTPPTHGLPVALANFTSCLWSLDFDRPLAVADLSAASSSGNGSSSADWPPVDSPPYVFLDSVVLLVPRQELLLLAWCAAHNSTAVLTDPRVAQELAASLLAASQLLQPELVRAELEVVLAAPPPPDEEEAASAATQPLTSITFRRFRWCGLQGLNVTLASQLPYVASTTSGAADLALPLSWAAAAPAQQPDPSGEGLPCVEPPCRQQGTASPQQPPMPTHAPATTAASDQPPPTSAESNTGNPPAPEEEGPPPGPTRPGRFGPGAIAAVAACLAAAALTVLGWAAAACACGRSRERRRAAPAPPPPQQPAEGPAKCYCGSKPDHCTCAERAAAPSGGYALHSLAAGRGMHQVSGELTTKTTMTTTGGGALGALLASRWLAQRSRPAAQLGLAVLHARMRDRIAGIQESLTASDEVPHELDSALRRLESTAPPPLQHGEGWWLAPGSSPADTGHGGGCLTHSRASLLFTSTRSIADGSTAAGTAPASSSSYPSPAPALVLLGELGRGAQGAVYAGRWRGLDVAVKSILLGSLPEVQLRLEGGSGQQDVSGSAGGAGESAARPHPLASAAVLEAAIAVSLSHPNIVATYTYELRGLREGSASRLLAERAAPSSGGGGELAAATAAAASGGAASAPGTARSGPAAPDQPEAWRLLLIMERCNAGSLRAFLAASSSSSASASSSSSSSRIAPHDAHQAASAWDEAPAASTPHDRRAPASPARHGAFPDGAVDAAAPPQQAPAPSTEPRPQPQPGPPAVLAVRLALQVARGMSYLHGRGVAHGDLSSANVLLHLQPDAAGGAGGTPLEASPPGHRRQAPSAAQAADQQRPEGSLPQSLGLSSSFSVPLSFSTGFSLLSSPPSDNGAQRTLWSHSVPLAQPPQLPRQHSRQPSSAQDAAVAPELSGVVAAEEQMAQALLSPLRPPSQLLQSQTLAPAAALGPSAEEQMAQPAQSPQLPPSQLLQGQALAPAALRPGGEDYRSVEAAELTVVGRASRAGRLQEGGGSSGALPSAQNPLPPPPVGLQGPEAAAPSRAEEVQAKSPADWGAEAARLQQEGGDGSGAAGPPPPRLDDGSVRPGLLPQLHMRRLSAKICDFGLSHRLRGGGPDGDLTHVTGPQRCSSLYSAPELVRDGHSGYKQDVYAFGVLLWELAAGLPLPELLARPAGRAAREWLRGQAAPGGWIEVLPPGLLVWPEGIPRGLQELAESCLRERPAARPDFRSIVTALERMAAGKAS